MEIYTYKNLVYPLADDQEAVFSVEYDSDATRSFTTINLPGDNDPTIKNDESVLIGKGLNLRQLTVCNCSAYNIAAEETEIRIRFRINGDLIKEHVNLKSKEARPLIALQVTFKKP